MTEETIFLTALEQATPALRAAYLDAACAGDPALRQRVESLLRSHADPDSFLDMPAIERRAEGTSDPMHTTDVRVGGDKGAAPKPRKAELGIRDEELALLTPGGESGSLGRLNHYEILEVAGRGGLGVVFKAWDPRLRRLVAIKVLAAHLAASGPARQLFFREARSAAAVSDEHVVVIHEVSDENGPTPYLVMQFIAGVTLEERIKARGPLAVKEILRIGMQAAEGLAAAHRQGVIHRDVKPANILLENGVERVKIADFGLARARNDASLSRSGVIAGTPLFMSPEQARSQSLDARSDLFSLGSVLYTLCTGRVAFAADNPLAVLKRVCEHTPPASGFVIESLPEHRDGYSQVWILGSCPGVLLDRLDLRGHAACNGIGLFQLAHSGNDRPVVIQNCTMSNFSNPVRLLGHALNNPSRPVPCGHVVVTQNTMSTCNECVVLQGAVHRVLVVGNRLMNARMSALDLEDPLMGTQNILIANNTVFRSDRALRIWDDHQKDKEFLKCMDIRVLNNLLLASGFPHLLVLDHARRIGPLNAHGPGDVKALLESPGWRFGHNWREGTSPIPGTEAASSWIPPYASDRLVEHIELLSRKPGNPNFLRPPKDSPLAYSGAGGHTLPAAHVASALGQAAGLANRWTAVWSVAQTMNQPDRALPAYVGAVPPEGVAAWDWEKTWKMMTR